VRAWKEFEASELKAAAERGAPVLLVVSEGRSPDEIQKAFAGLEDVVARFITISIDKADRPDLFVRYAERGEILLLSHDGGIVESASLDEISKKLPEWLSSFSSKKIPPVSETRSPSWTGAVGGPGKPTLSPDRPREGARSLLSAARLPPAAVELLIHAAVEWGDAPARARAETELALLTERISKNELGLYEKVWAIRLLWEGFAAFGADSLRRAAAEASETLLTNHFDSARHAFRHAADAGSPVYADENALAVLALQRAAVFEPSARYGQTADEVLAFLQNTAYDPMLGMIHRRRDDGALVYGLLGDAAWTILACTEAFALTGHKPHREFADNLARFLFQELWDRDGGGFLDRVPQKADLGLLREPRLARPEENAAALEGLWRLHHLKGNMNYRRWLEWALARLSASQDPAASGILRVQDMLQRGRLDLELIGRPGGEGVDALIAALHRHYAPRRILSFVDPDDQDYIMAHRLETPGYPRLFGCVDLKPVASAGSPAEVAAVMKALS
jgi:hypothetical protein